MIKQNLKAILSSKRAFSLPYALLLLSLLFLLTSSLTHQFINECKTYETKEVFYDYLIEREKAILIAKQAIIDGEVTSSFSQTLYHDRGRSHYRYSRYFTGDIDVRITFYFDDLYDHVEFKYIKATNSFESSS